MLPTGTSEGAAGGPGATTLLLAAAAVVATAAAADLLRTHRREGSGGAAGAGAARRSRRRARTLLALVVVDVWVLAAGVLQVSGADAGSRPLLVGLVYGVVGCATAAAAVAALVLLAQVRSDAGQEAPVGPRAPVAARTLASVSGPRGLGARAPRPLAGHPATAGALAVVAPPAPDVPDADALALGTSGARGLSGARERAAAAARRREERELRRGRQRRETVTAVETVLGRRGRAPAPAEPPGGDLPWSERAGSGAAPGPLAPRSSGPGDQSERAAGGR